MFGRKKSNSDDDRGLPELGDELGIPVKPGARPAGTATPLRPTAPLRPAETPRPAELGQRPGDPARAGDATRRLAEASAAPPAAAPAARRDNETRKLIVGREISLSGEITSCDRLVVEGSVEANLANCRDIDIAESGLFKGSASIDDAEVRGRFEGTLTVRRRLLIRSTGQVTGTVRYGQIEIECGGQISGEVQSQPIAETGDAPASSPARASGSPASVSPIPLAMPQEAKG